MIGLSILAALTLYGWISFGVVWLVVKWAKKRDRSPLRWGILAGLIMYHLVFWDFIPTYVVYKYYCATKAGFWVYKTPEQWKAENPGVAETLTFLEKTNDYIILGERKGYRLNERIIWFRNVTDLPIVPVSYSEHVLVDVDNDEILARRVGVGAGRIGTGLTRFWTHFGPFVPGSQNFSMLITQYQKIGRNSE